MLLFYTRRAWRSAVVDQNWALRDPKTPQKKLQKRHKPADFRRRHKNKTLKGTFEFLEFIDQSEFRVVPEELEAFLDAQNSDANITW